MDDALRTVREHGVHSRSELLAAAAMLAEEVDRRRHIQELAVDALHALSDADFAHALDRLAASDYLGPRTVAYLTEAARRLRERKAP